MDRNRIGLPRGFTPEEGYELLMRRGAFYYAACIARDYGLGRSREIVAAYKAFCRFDELGFEDEAVTVAEEFGLKVIVTYPEQLAAAAEAAEMLRLPDIPADARRKGSDLPN